MSMSIASPTLLAAYTKLFHFELNAFVATLPHHDAKPSLSHKPSHQLIATRLPNQLCDTSWQSNSEARFNALTLLLPYSTSIDSTHVIQPQFYIPPIGKSGTATTSSLGSGNLHWKNFSKYFRANVTTFNANAVRLIFVGVVYIRTTTSSTIS